MKIKRQNKIYWVRAAAILIFSFAAASGFLLSETLEKTNGAVNAETAPTPRRAAQRRRSTAPRSKYANFSHTTHTRQLKMDCAACHKFPTANWRTVRKGDAAFPDVADFPKHETCLNCHRQQFFNGTPPAICANCHTNPSPNNGARHTFPNPREIFDQTARGKTAVSEFAVTFPHDKHIEIVSRNDFLTPRNSGESLFIKANYAARRAEESCAVCHQTYLPQGDGDAEYVTIPPAKLGDAFWLKKGTFKTAPISHAACFTCHSADTGIAPAPSNCAACHQIKPRENATDFDAKIAAPMKISDRIMMLAWRRRDASATFRHEWFSHSELACATCHDAAQIKWNDAQTKKVKIISCGGAGSGCHITPTADDGGILNAEIDTRKSNANYQCAKCHLSYGGKPVPESHLKAIAEMAGKSGE